ncbi:hypothetical protein BH09BAC3_BH09BAC3_13290 [soil metagenome]
MKPKKDQADISGIFGESVSFRKVNGRVVAKIRRKRNMDNPTENQIAYKSKFLKASSWAKKHVENEENRAFYEARITKKRQSAYSLALKDFSKPPRVDAVSLEDEHGLVEPFIRIDVYARFMVTRVHVVISDHSGNKMEEGKAARVPEHRNLWEYAPSVAKPLAKGMKVTATAFDRAEHSGSLEVVL